MSLLDLVQERAAQSGLNLFGMVDASRFDSCQPCDRRSTTLLAKCGTIVVLATGGRSFWLEYARLGRQLPERVDNETVEELAISGAQSVRDCLQELGVRSRLLDPRRAGLNFGQLAEAAGIGIVSPVSGLLLHPEYGPWVRVRAALLVEGRPFGEVADQSIADRFRPCCTCDRPCVSACPSSVHDGFGNTDRAACAGHRHGGGCSSGCESRAACPLGTEHRDDGVPLHAHSVGLSTMQRHYGLGFWRMVPRFLRGGPRR